MLRICCTALFQIIFRFASVYSGDNKAAYDELVGFGYETLLEYAAKHETELSAEQLTDRNFMLKIYGLLKYKLRNYAAKTCIRSSIFPSASSRKDNESRVSVRFFGNMAAEEADETDADGEYCPESFYDGASDNDFAMAELRSDFSRVLSSDETEFLERRLCRETIQNLADFCGISKPAAFKRLAKICKKLVPLGESLRACA